MSNLIPVLPTKEVITLTILLNTPQSFDLMVRKTIQDGEHVSSQFSYDNVDWYLTPNAAELALYRFVYGDVEIIKQRLTSTRK